MVVEEDLAVAPARRDDTSPFVADRNDRFESASAVGSGRGESNQFGAGATGEVVEVDPAVDVSVRVSYGRTDGVHVPVGMVVGDSLCVSADVAPSGFVKITLLDKDDRQLAEGELVTTTVSDAKIEWKNGFSLKKLKGKDVKVKAVLRESKLFSFSFH